MAAQTTDRRWVLDPDDPAGPAFRSAIASTIEDYLAGQGELAARWEIDDDLGPLYQLAAELTASGKRFRPALCVWGWVAAGGDPTFASTPDLQVALLRVAASLDLLHVSALVHDDVMDGSDLRRGRPSAHRQLEQRHQAEKRTGEPEAFGRAGAILLGDLLLMWSTEMLQRSGYPAGPLRRAIAVAERMRTEVTCGQYLDIVAQTEPLDPAGDVRTAVAAAERVTEFKSARYTIVRPSQLGATLAGAGPEVLDRLAAYGLPLGRAFQYRDDLLGVFGDSTITGKPAGDDLREGKRTVLIAHARGAVSAAGRSELDRALGRPDLSEAEIGRLQQLITDSGAVQAVESMITADHDRALAALDSADLDPVGRRALRILADAAVRRNA